HHGEAQADRYGVSLIEAFEMLAESPMAGKVEDSVLADARCLIHELHSIYYWLEGDVVVIDRILHQMQDPLRHL
ncbi:MAG: type II toxin-antitoxin system RelE/ParE family toxin, partial [Asticcacaulis sp.]|nr:type II toxin-antitoxin system RelE/ParE family toxin [Asticcacaulis sp.]